MDCHETFKEMSRVALETFLVVVGVALHSFFRHYKMGADLGFPNADEKCPQVKSDPLYWMCYWLTLIVLVSLSLRFIVGASAHLSVGSGSQESVSVCKVIWNFSALMAFGVMLVQASLSRSHRNFMLWLGSFSFLGFFWSLTDGTAFGRWWWKPHLAQILVILVCWLLLGKPEIPQRAKLVGVLAVLAAVYAAIFFLDVSHIMHIVEGAGSPGCWPLTR